MRYNLACLDDELVRGGHRDVAGNLCLGASPAARLAAWRSPHEVEVVPRIGSLVEVQDAHAEVRAERRVNVEGEGLVAQGSKDETDAACA